VIESPLEASLTGQKPGKRVVMAGVVGIILPVGLLTWVALMTAFFPDARHCGSYTGCLGFLLQAWDFGRWVALVLAWPLLYLLRVRPSWPVAALAALFLVAIWQFATALLPLSFDASLGLILFSGVIAYPADCSSCLSACSSLFTFLLPCSLTDFKP
jgi:hypothetical protein